MSRGLSECSLRRRYRPQVLPFLQPKAYAFPVDSMRHARYNTSVGNCNHVVVCLPIETFERVPQLNRYGVVGIRPGTQMAFGLACSVNFMMAEVEVTHDGQHGGQ